MRYFAAGLTVGLATLGSAQDAEVHHGDAPHSDGARLDVTRRPDASGRSSALSGSPLFFEVSGVAGSKNPVVDVGDFRLRVKVTADALVDDKPPTPLGTTEFELDLCTDVVGVACPLAVGDEFSGVVSWHAVVVPDDVDAVAERVVVKVAQPHGSACGQTFEFDGLIEKIPAEETGELLDDHLHLLLQKDGGEAAPSWKKGYSPRFEGYSWEDARRISGGTVMRGHLGFEELPVRRYIKESTDPADSAVADAGAVAEGRRLISEEIPVNFDSRTAFPECASVIGRVRDQSDCGSCWAFASTEAFNDRRCISGIGKEGSHAGEATADQLLVLSAEDTTACCHGFRCGLSMGCNGGQPGSAWGWFTKTGVVSGGDYADIGTGTTCKPYEFMPCAHHVDPGASGYPACPDHEYPTPECFKECSETSFSGGTYGEDKKMAREAYSLGGIEDIQLDMMKYGSVTAAFSVYSDFLTYAGGVYSFDSGSYMGGHAVKIIGWGTDEESGEDYWLVANSWNPSWGEGGMFRILRGVNECGIEGQIVTGEV